MRILVTNDDGVNSEGLDVCEKIARELSDDVWVVAPEFDQSGVAHSLSLNDSDRSLRQTSDNKSVGTGCQLWVRKRLGVLWSPVTISTVGSRAMMRGIAASSSSIRCTLA